MRQRILAIVAAVALVAVAFVARSVIADDGDGGGGGGGGGSKPVVACTPDLAAVCAALADEGRIADDPPTLDLDGAATPPADIDGWITWDPAPGIANLDAEQDSGTTWGSGRALGSSALAVAIRSSGGSFPSGCTQNSFTWSCLAGAPATSAIGVGTGKTAESLARLYPVALALVPQDGDFTDLPSGRLRQLIDSPAVGQKAFPSQLDALQTQPGALNFLVGPVEAFNDADKVTIISATPAATAVVAFVPRSSRSVDLPDEAFGADSVTKALRDAGLDPGTGKLAGEDRAGDLYAVRDKVG
ncbi:hypothetical protein BH10ACT1_BH10ACT1_20170 [soil metagenome]